MADLSSTVNHCKPLPYPVVQYIERYGDCLHFLWLAPMRLWVNAKEIHDVRNRCMHDADVGTWIKGGGIGVEAVQRIHCVMNGTPTVSSLGIRRSLGTTDALATYWVIYRRPPFRSGLLIWLI